MVEPLNDLSKLIGLKRRIEFLRHSISEAELIHDIEQKLTAFCGFQCTFSFYYKTWKYSIRVSIPDTNSSDSREPLSNNRLTALYTSIETLIKGIY